MNNLSLRDGGIWGAERGSGTCPTQILSDQLTLSQLGGGGGQIMPTVLLIFLYTPVKSYVVKQPQEKWACDFHDDAPPFPFQLQIPEVNL